MNMNLTLIVLVGCAVLSIATKANPTSYRRDNSLFNSTSQYRTLDKGNPKAHYHFEVQNDGEYKEQRYYRDKGSMLTSVQQLEKLCYEYAWEKWSYIDNNKIEKEFQLCFKRYLSKLKTFSSDTTIFNILTSSILSRYTRQKSTEVVEIYSSVNFYETTSRHFSTEILNQQTVEITATKSLNHSYFHLKETRKYEVEKVMASTLRPSLNSDLKGNLTLRSNSNYDSAKLTKTPHVTDRTTKTLTQKISYYLHPSESSITSNQSSNESRKTQNIYSKNILVGKTIMSLTPTISLQSLNKPSAVIIREFGSLYGQSSTNIRKSTKVYEHSESKKTFSSQVSTQNSNHKKNPQCRVKIIKTKPGKSCLTSNIFKDVYDRPFYKATNELEGQDDCTLHLVIPWIKKLQLHCAVNETDSPEIQTLKSNALEFIKLSYPDGEESLHNLDTQLFVSEVKNEGNLTDAEILVIIDFIETIGDDETSFNASFQSVFQLSDSIFNEQNIEELKEINQVIPVGGRLLNNIDFASAESLETMLDGESTETEFENIGYFKTKINSTTLQRNSLFEEKNSITILQLPEGYDDDVFFSQMIIKNIRHILPTDEEHENTEKEQNYLDRELDSKKELTEKIMTRNELTGTTEKGEENHGTKDEARAAFKHRGEKISPKEFQEVEIENYKQRRFINSDVTAGKLMTKDKLLINQNITVYITLNHYEIGNFIQKPVFWKKLNRTHGMWSSKGCTTNVSTKYRTTFTCNHLTNFAILVTDNLSLPIVHEKILSYVTLAGISISMISEVATLIILIFLNRNRLTKRQKIIVHLMSTLFASQLIFVSSVERGVTNPALCAIVTLGLSYGYTSSLFWMFNLALHLLFCICTRLISKRIKLWQFHLIGYGMPGLIQVIILSATKSNGYGNTQRCWLTGNALYGFIVPLICILLANVMIGILALLRLHGTRVFELSKKAVKAKKLLKAVFVLTPSLGLSWVTGIVLFVAQKNVVLHYLFAIINSLQGALIFISCVLMDQKARSNLHQRFPNKFSTSSDEIRK